MPAKRAPAVFLDRDGTLIYDRPGHYLRRPEDARIYKSTFEALRLLKRAGFRLVVVSNQSGIGRGYLDEPTLARIHARIQRQLRRRGAALDAIYYCPHHPDDGCRCRKPSPVLARRAAREMGLSMRGSFVVGDKKVDLDLGRALGLPAVLVRTGHGEDQRRRHGPALRPAHEARDILGAARWIVRKACAPLPALLLALLLAPAARAQGGAPVAISSRTVSSPYDLVRGSAPAPADRAAWFPEVLEYEVKWGVLSMGFADLGVQEVVDFNGHPAYHIVSHARSSPFADHIYKVRDLNESWVSAANLASLGYQKKLREGDFQRDEWVLYDYPRLSWLSKRVNKDASFSYSAGAIPGQVQDILSSLYFMRPKKLKVGDEFALDVNTRENWPLKVKVLYRTVAEVPAGRFRCVVVEPFVRQEGIFISKGKSLKVWLTDDERHLPVMMKVDIVFGSVSTYLQKVRK